MADNDTTATEAAKETKAENTETVDMTRGELIPPEGTDKVGISVYKVLEEILKYKKSIGLPDHWKKCHEMQQGDHWPGKPAGKAASFIAVNLTYTHLQKNVNMLTDNNPTFNIARLADVKPEEEEAFELMQHGAEHWWIDQEQQDVFDTSVNKGECYGVCIEKVIFNRDLEFGIGEVETLNVDPFHFGVYPPRRIKQARHLQKSEAVLHFYPMSLREARNRWPDKANEIRPDREYKEMVGDDRLEVAEGKEQGKTGLSRYISVLSNVIDLLGFGASGGTEGAEDELLVVEAWVRDRSRIKDEETGKTRPKYTGEIRYITCCNGGNVVMEDRDNPSINPELEPEQAILTYLFDKFPFIVTNSVKNDVHMWGMSEIGQLELLNKQFNKSISQLVTAKDKVSKLVLMNPRTSGVKNEDLNNYSVTVQPSSALESQGIKYLEPPKLPQEIAGSIELFKDLFFLVSQSFDLDRGRQAGSNVIAYKAIAALLEQATTMMKGKIRNYSRLVRERGRMYLSHAQNWYTEDRWITYTDENGEQVSKAIKNTSLLFPAKLTVVTGSTMPVSKVQRREEAISLFQGQGCDLEYLHEALETPHRTELIKRMRLGTVGVVFDKLRQLGTPEPVIEYLTKVTEAKDDKELKRMLERGEIPPFMQFAQMLMQAMMQRQQGQQQPQGPSLEEQADMAVTQAKIDESEAKVLKAQAETAYIAEKIVTERVEQRVKLKGMELDDENMALERLKVLGELGVKMKGAGPSTDKPGYNEQGMQSNNVE